MSKFYGYDILIETFLKKEITVKEFESEYLKLHLEGNHTLGEILFNILDGLFFYVDCYTDLPITNEDDPDFTINEEQLRERAAEALHALQDFENPDRK